MNVLRTKQELVDYCKANYIMLLATPGQEVVFGSYIPGGNDTILRTGGHPLDPNDNLKTVAQLIAVEPSGFALSPKLLDLHVPEDLLRTLNGDIQSEIDAVRRLSSWPITRAFVCLDVSDFSKYPHGQQVQIVNSINKIIQSSDWYIENLIEPPQLEARLCIGDGYIFVCSDPVKTTFFGARLAHLIDCSVADKTVPAEFHYRMGLHIGEVYCFWDPGRKGWNYIGDGINGATRILQAIGKDLDDVVYVSGQLRQYFLGDHSQTPLMTSSQGETLYEVIRDHFDNRGRKKDKHEEVWRVYQLNHTKVGTTPEAWGHGTP